jgi:hypothetical protein
LSGSLNGYAPGTDPIRKVIQNLPRFATACQSPMGSFRF